MQAVYILHFDIPTEDWKFPYSNRFGGNLHYVGIAEDVKRRVMQHKRGKGSSKTKAAYDSGVSFTASVFKMDNNSDNERYVTINVEKYCPYCLGIYGKSQYKAGWSKLLNAT